MLNFTAAPSSGVPSWNLMPSRTVHRPLGVVGVVVDRLGEQRDDLVVVADREQRVRHRREVHVAARGARRAVRHPAVGAVGLEAVDERAALDRLALVLERRAGRAACRSSRLRSTRSLPSSPRSSPPWSSPPSRPPSSSCRPLRQCRESNPWRPSPAWSSRCWCRRRRRTMRRRRARSRTVLPAPSSYAISNAQFPLYDRRTPRSGGCGQRSVSTGCPRVALHLAAAP